MPDVVEAVRTPIGRRNGGLLTRTGMTMSDIDVVEITDASTALVTMCCGGRLGTGTILERV